MRSLPATEARQNFADILRRASGAKERIVIERRGRPAVAVVPIEDLEAIQGPAHKDLRAREAALAKAQRIAKIGHWRWSIERDELVSCSDEYARIHGVTPDGIHDLMRQQMARVIYPEDRRRVAEDYRRVDENGEDYEIEYRIVRPDGEVRHVLEIGEVVSDGSGRAVEHIGTVQDITERKEVEKALAEKSALLDGLIENSPINIAIKDTAGRYVLTNPEYDKAFGLSGGEIQGKTLHAVFPKDMASKFARHDREVVESRTPFVAEDTALHADGTLHTYLSVKFPVLNSEGTSIGVALMETDITERKHAEKALRERDAQLRAIMDNAPVEIYLKDAEGRYARINRRYEELWGVEDSTARGKLPSNVHMERAFADSSRAHDLAVLTEGRTIEIEDTAHMEDGVHTFHVIKFPIRDDKGHITGLGGVATDITERRRVQDALRETEERLDFIAESSNVPLFITRKSDGAYLYFNSAGAEIFGLTVEQLKGRSSREFYDDLSGRQALLAELEKKGAARNFELKFRKADGSPLWVLNSVTPTTFRGEEALLSTVIDITERRHAQEELKRAHDDLELRIEERTRELHTSNRALEEEIAERKRAELVAERSYVLLADAIEALDEGFIIFDDRNRMVMCNRRYRQIYHLAGDRWQKGMSAEELAGDVARSCIRLEPEQTAESWVQRRLAQIEIPGLVTEQALLDGRWIRASDYKLANGWSAGVRTEITEVKQREAELNRRNRAAQLLQRISSTANESRSVDEALEATLNEVCAYTGWPIGHVYRLTEDGSNDLVPTGLWRLADEVRFEGFCRGTKDIKFKPGVGLPGRVLKFGRPEWIADVTKDSTFLRAELAEEYGIKTGVAFPILIAKEVVAVLEFYADKALPPDQDILDIMANIGVQIGRTIERSRAETALRENEERFRDFAESSADWFWEMDSDLRFTYVSENVERILGIPPEWHYGKTREELLGDDYDHDAWAEHLRTLRERRPFRNFEFLRVAGGVKPTWLRTSGVPVFGPDGAFLGYRGTGADITGRKESEQALRASEELFSRAFHASPAVFAISRPEDGAHYDVNETWMSTLGYTHEEAMAHSALELGLWAYDRERAEFVERLKKERSVRDFEATFRAKDGRKLNFLIAGEYIEIGDEPRLLVVSHDITERKRIGDELARSEERLRQATQLAGLGHWVWDAVEDKCIYCSEENARIHGVSVETYMTNASALHGDFSFVHPEDREATQGLFKALRNGEGFEAQYRVIWPTGETRYVREVARPIFDFSGKIVREYGTIQDITEQKLAEDALSQREKQLRLITDNLPVLIVYVDSQEIYRFANKTCADWFGCSARDIIGKTVHEAHGEEYYQFQPKILQALSGEVTEFERTVTYPDHKSRRVRVLYIPHRNDDGEIMGFISLAEDVTEQREVAEKLHQSQKMEAVGQLTGGIAHDFNNLLTIVIGNLDMLNDHLTDDATEKGFLQTALKATFRGADLTQQLLAFSRKQTLTPKLTNVNKLVMNMTELMRRSLAGNIEIETILSGSLWQTVVDPGQLENALLNLSINARDALPKGGTLTIQTSNHELARGEAKPGEEIVPGRYVLISVSDTGTGIAPDVIEHVFEPFFTTKEVGKGSGLGLSMVYGFIRQSGGHVSIQSEVGRGTTIRLYLPKAEAAGPTESVVDDTPKALPRGSESVLIVEDDPDVRSFVTSALRRLGYHVLEADDGAAVLSRLEDLPGIDLLITDVVLPGGMHGHQIAEEIETRRPDIKVLFMSGYAETAVAHHRQQDRNVEILAKPFTRDALAHRIRAVLDVE